METETEEPTREQLDQLILAHPDWFDEDEVHAAQIRQSEL